MTRWVECLLLNSVDYLIFFFFFFLAKLTKTQLNFLRKHGDPKYYYIFACAVAINFLFHLRL